MNGGLTILTTCSGKFVDLLAPAAVDIDFAAIAEHLAKANRFCGATPDCAYSVAEHSTRAAMAAQEDAAPYLLCHDMHEAFLGDDTTPKKRALTAICGRFGVLAGTIECAFAELTERFDAAIHEAAGLAWPPPPEIAAAVKYWDRVMLATEWRDLMRCAPPYDLGVAPLKRSIVPHARWRIAGAEFLDVCMELLPALKERPL